MKRAIAAVILIFLLFINVSSFAADIELRNVAPEVNFTISSKDKIDLLVITNFSGSKLADLDAKLSDLKISMVENGVNLDYKFFNSSYKVGMQSTTIPVDEYYRIIYFSYTQNNIQGWEAPATIEKTDIIPYERCEVSPGEDLPPLQKGDNVSMYTEYTDYQGLGWCYIGKSVYFYNPSNFNATKYEYLLIEQWSNGYDSTPSGFYVRSYSNLRFQDTNKWTYMRTYDKSVTSDIYGLNFSKLNEDLFRSDSEKYILIIGEECTVSYNKDFSQYYPFASMRSDNLGLFIKNNADHVYIVCSPGMENVKLSDSKYGVSYTNAADKQDSSLKNIINFCDDGRIYGNLSDALNSISRNAVKSKNNNLDIVIATDLDQSVVNNFKSKLEGELNDDISVNYKILGKDDRINIDQINIPSFKKVKKQKHYINSIFTTSFVLTDDGNLYARGNNVAYHSHYSSNTYEVGIFGNSVSEYGTYTQIADNVKDFELLYYTGYQSYYGSSIMYRNFALFIIKNDGTVWSTGTNFGYILDPNSYHTTIYKGFRKINGLENIKQISFLSSDMEKTCLAALDNNGDVYYIGRTNGYLLSPSTDVFNSPTKDSYLSNIDFISTKQLTLFAASGKDVYVKGRDYGYNKNAGNVFNITTTSAKICMMQDIISELYSPMTGYKLFIKLNNNDLYIYSTVADYYNGVGGIETIPNPPVRLMQNVKNFYLAGNIYVILTLNGDLYFWGTDYYTPYCFKNSKQSMSDRSAPQKCNTINNIEDIYMPIYNLMNNEVTSSSRIYFKKKDGTYYVGGTSLTNSMVFKTIDPSVSFDALTPVKIEPSETLAINDFIYILNNLYALDLLGETFIGSHKLDPTKTFYVYDKNSLGYNTNIYIYTVNPIYAVDVSKILDFSPRNNSERYFIFISNGHTNNTTMQYGDYFTFSSISDDLINYLYNNNFIVYTVVPEEALTLKLQKPYVSNNYQSKTLIDLLNSASNDSYYYFNIDHAIKMIINRFSRLNKSIYYEYTLIADEDLAEYNLLYNDLENDPICDEQWLYVHDNNYFENSNGTLPASGQWINEKIIKFSKVGKYTIRCKVQDNPNNDPRFSNYRLWSSPSDPFTLYVHRRPIADFSAGMIYDNTLKKNVPFVTDLSYDLDHESAYNKGIIEHVWKWKPVSSNEWNNGMIPNNIATNQKYHIYLQVKDIEGAYSYPKIIEFDPNTAPIIVNRPPTVSISVSPSIVYDGDNMTINIIPSDPDNDKTSVLLQCNINNTGWTSIYSASNCISNQVISYTIDNVIPGVYQFAVTVTDAGGLSASGNTSVVVNELGITGYVMHTELWNNHRQKYNIRKSNNPDLPRGYNVFFPGEKFVLSADTTEIKTGRPDLKADSVICQILDTPFNTSLSPDGINRWSGSIWDAAMGSWRDRSFTFRFTVTYSNGAQKQHDVIISIVDDEYWRLHMLF